MPWTIWVRTSSDSSDEKPSAASASSSPATSAISDSTITSAISPSICAATERSDAARAMNSFSTGSPVSKSTDGM